MSSTDAAQDGVQRQLERVRRSSQPPAFFEQLATAAGERALAIAERRSRTAVFRGRGWLIRRALLFADVVGLLVALVVTEFLFASSGVANDRVSLAVELVLFCAALPAWAIAAKTAGLYDRDEQRAEYSTVDDLVGVFHLVTALVWLLAIGSWATGLASPVLPKLAAFWLLAVVALTVARAGARAWARRRPAYLQNAVIVGAGKVGQTLAAKLLAHPEYGVNLVGFVDSGPCELGRGLEHVAVLGEPRELMGIVRLLDVERVIVANGGETDESVLQLVRPLNALNVQVDLVPRLFELVAPGHQIHSVGGVPLIGLPPARLSRSSQFLKRAFDIVAASLGLALLAVPFAVIGLLIRLESSGPVFFRQVRMGQGDSAFRIWKFRTMSKDAEGQKLELAHLNKHALEGGDIRMFKIRQDPRVTRVGRTLRRFALDELPQLLNVLRGEMSLVGPRPLILAENQHVEDWGRRRLDLKPGITGLWQVLGRSDIQFDEMMRLDYVYVSTWSLWSDLRLLWRTVPVVCAGGEDG